MAGDAGTTTKTCGICRQDCSSKPRIKDAQGRYFCKQCVDDKAAQQAPAAAAPVAKARPVSKAISPALPDQSEQNLMARMVEESMSKAAAACPGCRRPFTSNAVICTHCGYNRQTAQVVQTAVLQAQLPKEPGAAAKAGKVAVAGMSPLFALAGASVGGLVGGGLWFGIGYAAHLESGYIAWLVGFLVGCGAKVGANKFAGIISGLIAVAVAIASILGAKWMLIDYLISQSPAAKNLGIQVEDVFWNSFGLFDVAFILLAIGSAAVVGSGGKINGGD